LEPIDSAQLAPNEHVAATMDQVKLSARHMASIARAVHKDDLALIHRSITCPVSGHRR
jgi:hypothetical protein